MASIPAYDPDNIFTKIIEGAIPAHKVHEDDDVLVIMDVMPQADGHMLVIPKQGSRNLLDTDPDVLAKVMATAQKAAHAALDAFSADGISIMQFNEPAGGQSVFHLHVHVIPRVDGVALRPHTGEMADQPMLAEQCVRLKAAWPV